MPLSLTTRRRQQTSNAKWFSQQHLNQQHDISATTAATKNNLLRQQPVSKQRSFIDTRLLSTHPGRSSLYLSRGLSVGRSHDIQERSYNKSLLKKHFSITTQSQFNGSNNRDSCLKTNDLIQKNITACGKNSELLRNSRKTHIAWSSTSSILKTLDKELAQLNNGVVAKNKDVKKTSANNVVNVNNAYVHNVISSKTKPDPSPTRNSHSFTNTSHAIRKPIKSELNKVNLSIVLSHALNSTKEENGLVISDPEANESDDVSTDSNKCLNNQAKSKDSKKESKDSIKTCATRAVVPAQQRRALYRSSRLTPHVALPATNNNSPSNNNNNICGLESSQNFNASPLLTIQKRPPLVRAMSAPVRSFNETSKGSFLASKRKSRRRKLNTRNLSCDKEASDVLTAKNLNRKVLTRSKSVAADVITLVSLISSEGSDSEKEDNSGTPITSRTGSSTKRAPSLRKTGKSVSFQENYPPTFQFASKEYSHMLRRGSIAPLAQRIKMNRPPTAPAGSIFHTSNECKNEMSETSHENNEQKENLTESVHNNSNTNDSNQKKESSKPSEEAYQFPEYVRSLKERECWKLYMKMSTKGVNISYDTILRGMLTPTEFRQLQKQREVEEAKAKEIAEVSAVEEAKPKDPPTAIERLKESLLKN